MVLNLMTSMSASIHPPSIIQLTGYDKNSPTLLDPSRGVNHTQYAILSLITKHSVASNSFDDQFFKPSHIYRPSPFSTLNRIIHWFISWNAFSDPILWFNVQNSFLLGVTTSLYPGVLTGPSLLCEVSEFAYSGADSLLCISNIGIQLFNSLGIRSSWVGNLIHIVF